MLLLIKKSANASDSSFYLNTSNVTVNLVSLGVLLLIKINLNTSNVTVNHHLLYGPKTL